MKGQPLAKVMAKVWLEDHGEYLFGDGRARLLKEIENRGSISAAARVLGMSYRQAWEHLRKMERRLGRPLLDRRSGGRSGGGSRLTAFGHRLLEDFLRLRHEIEALLARRSRRFAAWRRHLRRPQGSRRSSDASEPVPASPDETPGPD